MNTKNKKQKWNERIEQNRNTYNNSGIGYGMNEVIVFINDSGVHDKRWWEGERRRCRYLICLIRVYRFLDSNLTLITQMGHASVEIEKYINDAIWMEDRTWHLRRYLFTFHVWCWIAYNVMPVAQRLFISPFICSPITENKWPVMDASRNYLTIKLLFSFSWWFFFFFIFSNWSSPFHTPIIFFRMGNQILYDTLNVCYDRNHLLI